MDPISWWDGTGADRFVWEGDYDSVTVPFGGDVVLDFSNGTDKIDLSAVDRRCQHAWTTKAFEWIGMDQPLTGAGQLTFAQGVVKADMDGYPYPADFEIQLNGVTTMSSSDFIL